MYSSSFLTGFSIELEEKKCYNTGMKKALLLFLTFFKIGLFTFGGGYAMISIIENEFVSRKKALEHDEFMDVIAIAESTPGPIAINCATYIGYKMGKLLGSVFATIGVVLPSLIIIFCISLFFDAFLSLTLVSYAFRGIQACVIYLILSAGIKMFKKLPKTPVNMIVLVAVMACMICFSLFAIKFSSIFYILISGVIGLIIYLIGYAKNRSEQKNASKVTTENEEENKQ